MAGTHGGGTLKHSTTAADEGSAQTKQAGQSGATISKLDQMLAREKHLTNQMSSADWRGRHTSTGGSILAPEGNRQAPEEVREETIFEARLEERSEVKPGQSGETVPWQDRFLNSERMETDDSSDEAVINRALMRAQKKFDKLDANGNGVLEGDELLGLAEWVWSSFHPGGVALTADEQQAESAKLLGRLDTNGDGCMSFVEFGAWFKRTCSSIERYRRGLAQGKPQQVPKGA